MHDFTRLQTSIHDELTAIGDFALSELAVIDCMPLSLWQTAVDLNLQTRTVSPELNKYGVGSTSGAFREREIRCNRV